MRRRTIRALLTAATGITASALAFAAAAGAASASSTSTPPAGAPIYTSTLCTGTCAQSGYQASGRDFRFAQAVITVPTATGTTGTAPRFYVGLSDAPVSISSVPGTFAHAGIELCACAGGWQGFFEVAQEGTTGFDVSVPLTGVHPGDGVFFSVYLNAPGNAIQFVATLPDGTTTGRAVAVNGPVYSDAVAVTDWGFTPGIPQPVPPAARTRLTQFLQGRFSTLNGLRGTFRGPWTLSPVEATTNGDAPPLGALGEAPAYLWNDGNSLAGLSGDAFGDWLYP